MRRLGSLTLVLFVALVSCESAAPTAPTGRACHQWGWVRSDSFPVVRYVNNQPADTVGWGYVLTRQCLVREWP